MAHKKGLGSSRNGRESNPNMLGVKVFAGQKVTGGEIIVRQRGTRFWPGEGTGLGRDHTIFATAEGTVQFKTGSQGAHDFRYSGLMVGRGWAPLLSQLFRCASRLPRADGEKVQAARRGAQPLHSSRC